MKKRALVFYQEHKDITITAFVFLIFGSVYYLLVRFTPFRIPCMFHLITGLCCPGCGVSRFFMELAHFRFASAAQQNYAVAILFPFWVVIGLIEFWFNPKAFGPRSKWIEAFVWASAAVLTLFGILRNLPGLEFLLPTL